MSEEDTIDILSKPVNFAEALKDSATHVKNISVAASFDQDARS